MASAAPLQGRQHNGLARNKSRARGAAGFRASFGPVWVIRVMSVEWGRSRHVRSAPKATNLLRGNIPPLRAPPGCEQQQQTTALFDHLVGAGQERLGYTEAD